MRVKVRGRMVSVPCLSLQAYQRTLATIRSAGWVRDIVRRSGRRSAPHCCLCWFCRVNHSGPPSHGDSLLNTFAARSPRCPCADKRSQVRESRSAELEPGGLVLDISSRRSGSNFHLSRRLGRQTRLVAWKPSNPISGSWCARKCVQP